MSEPRPLTFVPIASAVLSITGASAILYNLLSDHQRRFTSPYFRIMFGLSLTDCIFGFVVVIHSFLAPKGTPGLFYAIGNQASCEAVGFLRHFTAFIQPLYVASLSLYYLLVIKYDVSDDFFKKKVEPWLHVVSIGYPLLGSIVAESFGMFNPTPAGCTMSAYPYDCDDGRNNKTCTRGAHAYIFRWIFSGSVILFAFSVTVACMLSIILHVRSRERIMNRRFSFNNSEISRSRSLVKQYKAVTAQAFMYICSFFLVWIIPCMVSLWKTGPLVLRVLGAIFMPLQGFFNSIIYFWPRYVKTKEEHADKSFWWRLKDMIFTTTLAKEQRRVVRHAVRRRSSLITPTGSPQMSSSLRLSRTSPVNPEESPQRVTLQNPPMIPFASNGAIENTIDSESHVNDHGSSSPSPQISTIYYEPLVRFRQTRVEMNRSFDNIEGEDDPCIETESVKVQMVFESNRAFDKIEVEDGPSIESETATAATLATQHMCESDSKSST
jgi:hypothetical protein